MPSRLRIIGESGKAREPHGAKSGSLHTYELGEEDRLTTRQREIFGLLASGKRGNEVLIILGIKHHTYKSHLRDAYLRLRVHTLAQAIAEAIRRGEIR